MTKQKELRMLKAFQVTPQTSADFEALRQEFFKKTGIRVGHSEFFAYLVRQAKEKTEAN